VTVFLSASVPLPDRDPRFFETADVIAIRDAVKAFVQEFGPRHRVHFGGHPAVTPLVSLMMKRHPEVENQHLYLYQSRFFSDQFPEENFDFVHKVYVDGVPGDREQSLLLMRQRMLTDKPITAAFFIGGMEGVIDEYQLIKKHQPGAKCFPVASTGGASLQIFQSSEFDPMLINELTYRTLFRSIRKSLP